MRNSFFIPVMLFTAFFFSTCKTPVEVELYGDLTGIVSDAVTKAPISGAIVTLSPSSASTSTGSDGKYSFTKLDPLEYKIQVAIEGYVTNNKSLTVKAGETTTGDISLTSIIPVLNISVASFDFGNNLTSLPIAIKNTGKGVLNWTVSEDVDWISVNPLSGSTTTGVSNVIISVDRSSLTLGSYSQSISIISNGGNATVVITIIK